MRIVDTNVLARMMLQDDPQQGAKAERLVRDAVERGESLQVPDVVLAEIFWVLRQKGLARHAILQAAIELLDNAAFEFENHERAAMAVGLWAEHNVDFTDAYLAAKSGLEGAEAVISFDSDFKRLPVHWVQP
jgi:predicted nucleic-acid-binding protein